MNKGRKIVVCAREGGANTTPFQAAHFAWRNTPQNGGEKEAGKGGAEFPPDPPSAPPALRSRAWGGKRPRSLGIKTSKQNNFQFLLRKIWRAGDKKLKENCFALLAEFWRTETRSGANQEFFVQKRFELRLAIATNSDILKIQRRFVARSPRLRRVSLRKKPCISELNRKVGQIQIRLFGKANGGSFQFFPPMILFHKNH